MLAARPGPATASSPGLHWTTWAALLVVLLLGAALRLWGQGAGAPFRMGVDEPVIVGTALRMMRTGDLNPHFFDYGGLVLYLHAAIGSLAFLAGAMDGRWSHLDAIWEGDLLAAGRAATALLGALTIFLVFRVGLRWGTAVALIAALALAVLPTHVREAHFILTDTPLTLLVTWALLLSIRAVERPRIASVALAGLAVGLATAVKYNGLLALVMPLLAATALPPGHRLAGITASCAAAAAAFLVCAPYTVLDLPGFLNGLAFLFPSYNESRPVATTAGNYLAYLRNWFTWPGVLPAWLGYAALLVAAGGWATTVGRPRERPGRLIAIMTMSFPLAHFGFISTQSLQYGRYLMPLGPMLCLGLAAGLVRVAAFAPRPASRPALLAALTLTLLAPSAASAVAWNMTQAKTTTVELAAEWLVTHASAGDRVVSEAAPVHLPPRIGLTQTHRLIALSADDYRRNGVQYLLASSDQADRYYAAGDAVAIAAHRTLFAMSRPVATFVPDRGHPGATITILHVADTE